MKLFHTRSFVFTIIILSLTACGGGGGSDSDPASNDTTTPTAVELSGQFQKGPFIVGTEITIQELNTDLTPTGRSFQTETTSNLGDYLLPISLTNSLVEVSANGYYFNEVTGALSNGTLRLSALADTSDNTVININILTHLAKKRIRALVATGSTFSDAKQQAETEVRSLFSFDDSNTTLASFDQMDISQTGGSNAFLLLASSIFQKAYESSAELSEYIESLSQDLSGNGVVDNSTLTGMINTTELIVELDVVRTNLEAKYTSLGQSVVIPNFEQLINRVPVASIALNQSGEVGTPVILSGSNSTDIDNDDLQFSWTLISSPDNSSALIVSNNIANPSFIPDVAGAYTFSLTVSDGVNVSAPETGIISTVNRPPIAIAGEDQEVYAGGSLTLNSSDSYDPDNDELTYLWSSDKSSETSSSSIWNISSVPIPDPFSDITYTLTVTDSMGFEGTDQVIVKLYPTFTDNGDGTISDGLGHMWQKEDDGVAYTTFSCETNGYPCLPMCNEFNGGGYSDWRLPTSNELMSLVDDRFQPKINSTFFPNTKTDLIYTSNKQEGISNRSGVDFNTGATRGGAPFYERCIR